MQAGLYLTLTRGLGAPEARICYEHAEPLCHSLNRPLLVYSGLMGQWVFSLVTEKMSATMQIAKRVYSLAQEQHDSALMIGARRALAVTLYFLGDFETSRQYAMRGVHIWRLEGVQSRVEEVMSPAVHCLIFGALSDWHFGETARCHQNRKGAEIGFATETRRSNLRGISSTKSERVRRTWIPTTSLLTHPASYLRLG